MITVTEDVALRIFWAFGFLGLILGIRWIYKEVSN